MKLETIIAISTPLVEGLVPNDENTGQKECTKESPKRTKESRTCTDPEKYHE